MDSNVLPPSFWESMNRTLNAAQLAALHRAVDSAGSGSRDVNEAINEFMDASSLSGSRSGVPTVGSHFTGGSSRPADSNTTSSRGSSSNRDDDDGNNSQKDKHALTITADGSISGTAVDKVLDRIGDERGGGLSNLSIVGITVGGVLGLVAIIAAFLWQRQRRQRRLASATGKHDPDPHEADLDATINTSHRNHNPTEVSSYTSLPSSKAVTTSSQGSCTHLSDDPVIVAVRVPFEKILLDALISRGGFGEVFKGTYQNRLVAVKRLLPERRKDMKQIAAFFEEVKMMAGLEHDRIVRFVGVAWDSFSDLCVLSEFMEGGDLRAFLVQRDTEQQPKGFTADKVRIALHVAHALTYLHTLRPIILHRDLKSKNILLDANMNAKLTDFGVARERIDSTMTAGVGSSLWMAPEVMLGERYDEKADVFSFGVVLSELDTHTKPYAHATEPGTERRLPETAVLQLVAMGRLQVSFSPSALPAMVQLALSCVDVDPTKRPTAGEVLHTVHTISRQL